MTTTTNNHDARLADVEASVEHVIAVLHTLLGDLAGALMRAARALRGDS